MKLKVTMIGVAIVTALAYAALWVTPASALEDFQFRIRNCTTSPVVRVIARNTLTGQLYGDLLNGNIKPVNPNTPNSRCGVGKFDLDDETQHCRWNVQAFTKDGRSFRISGVNICNVTDWTIEDGDEE